MSNREDVAEPEGDDSADSSDLFREIDATLALVDADQVNLVFLLNQTLVRADTDKDRQNLLEYLAEHWEGADSSKEIKHEPVISQYELEQTQKRIGGLVNEMLDVLIRDNPPVRDFYRRFDELLSNPLLQSGIDRVFALYWVLIDKRMPYFHLEEGLCISNEDWRSLGAALTTERARLRFIVNSRFSQRSEEADLLLRELEGHDQASRTRLM